MMRSNTTPVLVADKHFLSREGLKCLLHKYNDYKVVGEAECDEQLLQLAKEHSEAILVVDFGQGKDFSLNVLHQLKKDYPELKLLVISDKREKHEILAALESGVNGYLFKECDAQEILDAFTAILVGDKFFCGQVLENVLEKSSPKACESLFLTPRELEIVQLVAKGMSTQEIAQTLCRSVHTINTHRKNIMAKLGLSKPSDLMLYAVKKGIVAA